MREMKDSGIEFIGEIPINWKVLKIKNLGEARNGLTYTPLDVCGEDEGTLVLRSSNVKNGKLVLEDNVYVSCKIKPDLQVKDGDILICSRNGSRELIGKNALINNVNASFGAFMMIYRCVDARFMYYVLNSPVFTYYLGSFFTSTINQLTGFNFGNMQIAYCPDKNERDSISEFLDRKCDEVDSIAADIQTQIDTLEQYKRSVITEAVTKGLNPDAEMKESGIPWCPSVPTHWIPTNPKALFKLRNQKAVAGERQLTASQRHGIVYQDEFMEMGSQKVVTVEKDFSILKHVEPNDFVISMRSFQGGLEYSEVSGSISSAYVMLIPDADKVYPPFYKWFFKSGKYINALQSTTSLVRDGQAMRYSNFVQVPLFIIPVEEQSEIADYLSKRCTAIDLIIAEKQQQLEITYKYKKSLIYEYVTGKKEVTV
jgi:type I restriction enzyme S subunit